MTLFEKFLEQKFLEQNPQVLDDDMPDAFDNWLGNLDGEEYIQYADEALSKGAEKIKKEIMPF